MYYYFSSVQLHYNKIVLRKKTMYMHLELESSKSNSGCFVPHGPVDTGAAFVNNLLRHNGRRGRRKGGRRKGAKRRKSRPPGSHPAWKHVSRDDINIITSETISRENGPSGMRSHVERHLQILR